MKVEYTDVALKQLRKLDKTAQSAIKKYMTEVSKLENPRDRGKRLNGNLAEYWRYRTGDYRILCKISDNVLTIFVFEVGNRKNVYL